MVGVGPVECRVTGRRLVVFRERSYRDIPGAASTAKRVILRKRICACAGAWARWLGGGGATRELVFMAEWRHRACFKTHRGGRGEHCAPCAADLGAPAVVNARYTMNFVSLIVSLKQKKVWCRDRCQKKNATCFHYESEWRDTLEWYHNNFPSVAKMQKFCNKMVDYVIISTAYIEAFFAFFRLAIKFYKFQ